MSNEKFDEKEMQELTDEQLDAATGGTGGLLGGLLPSVGAKVGVGAHADVLGLVNVDAGVLADVSVNQ
ncbi:MAG: hypothetical protein J2P37_03690 [Ktedonobacteraceae bacterium]|jgi:hypothetical protein|nr:hypothetical protein [Ktedonobacteraceae bacterium]